MDENKLLSEKEGHKYIDEMTPIEQRLFALEMRAACLEMHIENHVQILEKILEVLKDWNNGSKSNQS
jgi:hypothetical protein